MKITNKDLEKLYKEVDIVSTEEFIIWHHALGDKIRHLLFHEIIHNPGIRGKELLATVNISQPTLSFHIAQLLQAKLIVDKRDGQSHTYYPNVKMMLSYDKTIRGVHNRIIKRLENMFSSLSVFKEQIHDPKK